MFESRADQHSGSNHIPVSSVCSAPSVVRDVVCSNPGQTNTQGSNRIPVSSVGRALVCHVGGHSVRIPAGPTLRV